jgi:hypothetical protein
MHIRIMIQRTNKATAGEYKKLLPAAMLSFELPHTFEPQLALAQRGVCPEIITYIIGV